MKIKKMFAGILAAVMVLSLAVVPASAAMYPDVQDNHWARPYVEDMTKAGLFKGYSDGKFRPAEKVDNATVLALCARSAVSKELLAKIGADHLAEIQVLFPAPAPGKAREYSWFYNEFATCLELGILTRSELIALVQSNQLVKPATKAQFACYLVRAMGMESTARAMGAVETSFADNNQIPAALKPYVNLLNLYGVVEGAPGNKFEPNSTVNRAVAAKMLSRAIGEMKSKGMNNELPAYTTYQWAAGYITDTTAGSNGGVNLTLSSSINSTKTYNIPYTAKIYQDNRTTERTALKTGAYARVCYGTDGSVESVRVTAADRMKKVTGNISSIKEDSVVVAGKTYAINRFTEVAAGGKAGDRKVIDYTAGYSSAVMTVDSMDNVLDMKLSGGKRVMEGILKAVDISPTGITTITLSAYNGTTQQLTVPAAATITATGGVTVALTSGHVGRQLTLRVEDSNVNNISAIAVDTASKYIQGALRVINNKVSPATVSLSDPSTNRLTTYSISAHCAATYNDKPVALSALVNGSYVTAKVEGAMVTELSAWPGATYTSGKLTGINYANPTTLKVTRDDGAVVSFDINLTALEDVEILRGGKKATITQLQTGDEVMVTVEYNLVTRIEAKGQSANATGIVQVVAFGLTGAQITLQHADGTVKTYTASANVSVTQEGAIVQLKAINAGNKVALVTSGDQIVSVEILGTATSSSKLEGTVYQVDSNSSFTLLLAGGTPVVVNVPSDFYVNDTVGGSQIRVSSLKLGDNMEVWGSYAKQEFSATVAVRVR
ncbi:MAG: S-layer homology domain-containing protein [Oscillospiraceae bacterium]